MNNRANQIPEATFAKAPSSAGLTADRTEGTATIRPHLIRVVPSHASQGDPSRQLNVLFSHPRIVIVMTAPDQAPEPRIYG
jgi:hypothetical protein